ncbi:2-dehydro-3-deoxy-D-gluconate 5-dehydrogenase KduD [Catenuloplanes atrovinosus]|uniref:2-deoxy-D-gluconate 3-dehydrogenase n=1 Tax=Catenuloplanes atrovinosus TaxID=137266 RepID=A0AAE3YHI2_9ACTN|nr:2-dehydro-3-deoxy-D-gluconate 5-dehydrogenase KduD [Catenuloplanes atrovinosus]MDR7273500.1 2-deoxy-D-gluconate 3-dehydrogenase [Catenuloplanes atrovinosus]
MTTPFSLHGRTALVTGARTGMGRAIAVALAQAGADLVLHGRTDDLGETEAEVRKAGRQATRWVLDLAETAAIPDAVTALPELDILVNNAGIIRRAPAAEHPFTDWRAVLDVNLDAVFLLSRAIGARMLARGSGKIISVASMLSFQGGVHVPGYAAAKHGVAGLTKALACEWAARGVQVNAVAPGYMETDNTAALRADPVREAEIRSRIPAGRWGRPEDVAGAVVFLASPAADYVNGHVLAVDGGWLAR